MRIMPDPASSCDLKDLAAPNEDTLNRQRSRDDAPSPSLPPSLPLLLILLLPSLALPLPLLLPLPPLPLLLLLQIPLPHLRRRRPILQIASHFWPSSYSMTPLCGTRRDPSRRCSLYDPDRSFLGSTHHIRWARSVPRSSTPSPDGTRATLILSGSLFSDGSSLEPARDGQFPRRLKVPWGSDSGGAARNRPFLSERRKRHHCRRRFCSEHCLP